jgi:hypothetical protein
MNVTENRLDLSILPEEAQQEMRDFFQFLLQKYGGKDPELAEEQTERFAEFLEEPIEVREVALYPRETLHER